MNMSAAMKSQAIPQQGRPPQCRVVVASTGRADAADHADYLLVEEVARSGTGVVWKAIQADFARLVTLTRMTVDPGQDAVAARAEFLHAAVLAGMLQHPGILPVYDLAIDQDAVPFFTTPPDAGRPWTALMPQRTEDENLGIFLRVCEAVAFAHDHGVVHGDATAEHVLLGSHGSVMVAGWGKALRLDLVDERVSGAAHGSPAGPTPEQAAADPMRLAVCTDIHQLGGILHLLATGEPPHPDGHAARAGNAARVNRSDRPHEHGELAAIARRCLSSDPQVRFPTVADVQSAVQTYRHNRISRALVDAGVRALGSARISRSDDDYMVAIAHFHEAWQHGKSNFAAHEGLAEARFAYAEVAAARGDLDLAHRQISRAEHPATPGLAERIEHLRLLRRLRLQRLLMVKRIVWGVVGLGLGGLGIGLFLAMATHATYVTASEERIGAEMHLARQELAMKSGGGRWRPVFAEDFAGGLLGKDLAIVAGDWQVVEGRLTLQGAGPGRLALMVPGDAARIEVDMIGMGDLKLLWPLGSSSSQQEVAVVVRDSTLSLTVPGQPATTALRRPAVAGVAAHVVVERLGDACRVYINGERKLEAAIAAGSPATGHDQARLSVVAGAGTVLDNLLVDAYGQ